jgi:predicted TIM-barrel fold metal-dependent hydrolase
MSLPEMRALVTCDIREIVRIETLAQGLLAGGGSYASFVEAYRSALSAAAARAASLKSVIAYRSGLAVRPWTEAEARASHRVVAERVAAGGSPRLTEKPLLDTLFLIALEIAVASGRPIQVHAGWGDADVDLPQANPVLLRPIVEDPRWVDARIVVLHQAYPYFREAAFMAAVWPQVHLDLSLAIPYLGPGAAFPLVEILSLAPHSKLLYGSDVQGLPELFALSADWGRAALGEALEWIESRGGLPGGDARAVARRILSDNARDLYRL